MVGEYKRVFVLGSVLGAHCNFMLHLKACRGDTLITTDARQEEECKSNLINRQHTTSSQEQMLRGSETL